MGGGNAAAPSGCSSMVEQKPSKLTTRVRFPSPAELAKRDQRRSAREALASRGDKVPDALTRPTSAAIWRACLAPGEVAEWLKAADCKSARASVRWFESSTLHQPSLKLRLAGQSRNRCEGCPPKPWRRRAGERRNLRPFLQLFPAPLTKDNPS